MDREGPTKEPSWQGELDRISARQGPFDSWLKLVWVPGETWGPVERFFVYQMHHPLLIPEMYLADLTGEAPRSRGTWDRTKGYRADPACTIDQLQWQLYRDTGYFGRPFWVVQGFKGGHRRRWDRYESVLSRMKGGPERPPLPGDLPYCDPDHRLWSALEREKEMTAALAILKMAERQPELMDEEDFESLPAMEIAYAHWLNEQTDAAEGWAGADVKDAENADIDAAAKRRLTFA